MSSLLNRLKSNTSASTAPASTDLSKKQSQTPAHSTSLENLLQNENVDPGDGSDKFFGMYNFQNTCYCNSVVQCLYFTEPFRNQVMAFPNTTFSSLINANPESNMIPSRAVSDNDINSHGTEVVPKSQGLNVQPPVKPVISSTLPLKIDDSKEGWENRKKMAFANGPQLKLEMGAFGTYNMPESMFTVLKDLFTAVSGHDSHTGVVIPTNFMEILRRDHERYRSLVHQDAHEFLNLMLNEVTEKVEAHSKSTSSTPQTSSINFTKNLGKPDLAWLHSLFEGTLTSETRCLTCENISQRDEMFLDLSLDLESKCSLSWCLRKFSQEEMLNERNKFHCDQCGDLQEAEKRMKIKRLPQILALHLKRFEYAGDPIRFQKLFHEVRYPDTLRVPITTDDAEDPDRLYELYAVIVHIGQSPFHGHYVSIVKTKERGWLLFDDELVRPVSNEYVRNFFGGDPARSSACAYVLFYQQTTEDSLWRRQELPDVPVVEIGLAEDEFAILKAPPPELSPSSPTSEASKTPMLEGFDHSGEQLTRPTPFFLDEPPVKGSPEHVQTPLLSPRGAEDGYISEYAVDDRSLNETTSDKLTEATSDVTLTTVSKIVAKDATSRFHLKTGSFDRLRRSTSMSLKNKPRFWGKDKAAVQETVEPPMHEEQTPLVELFEPPSNTEIERPPTRTRFRMRNLGQVEVPPTPIVPKETEEVLPPLVEDVEKQEKSKTSRFSIRRKKSTMLE